MTKSLNHNSAIVTLAKDTLVRDGVMDFSVQQAQNRMGILFINKIPLITEQFWVGSDRKILANDGQPNRFIAYARSVNGSTPPWATLGSRVVVPENEVESRLDTLKASLGASYNNMRVSVTKDGTDAIVRFTRDSVTYKPGEMSQTLDEIDKAFAAPVPAVGLQKPVKSINQEQAIEMLLNEGILDVSLIGPQKRECVRIVNRVKDVVTSMTDAWVGANNKIMGGSGLPNRCIMEICRIAEGSQKWISFGSVVITIADEAEYASGLRKLEISLGSDFENLTQCCSTDRHDTEHVRFVLATKWGNKGDMNNLLRVIEAAYPKSNSGSTGLLRRAH
jgi:hypothetical protein